MFRVSLNAILRNAIFVCKSKQKCEVQRIVVKINVILRCREGVTTTVATCVGRLELFARGRAEIQAIVHDEKLVHVQLELFSISCPAAKAIAYAPAPLKAEAQSWSVGRFPEGSAEMLHVASVADVCTARDADSEPRLSRDS